MTWLHAFIFRSFLLFFFSLFPELGTWWLCPLLIHVFIWQSTRDPSQHRQPRVNQELRLNQFTSFCNIFHNLIEPPKHMWNYVLLFTIFFRLKFPSCGRNSWCDWLYPTNCICCALLDESPCPSRWACPLPATLPHRLCVRLSAAVIDKRVQRPIY